MKYSGFPNFREWLMAYSIKISCSLKLPNLYAIWYKNIKHWLMFSSSDCVCDSRSASDRSNHYVRHTQQTLIIEAHGHVHGNHLERAETLPLRLVGEMQSHRLVEEATNLLDRLEGVHGSSVVQCSIMSSNTIHILQKADLDV